MRKCRTSPGASQTPPPLRYPLDAAAPRAETQRWYDAGGNKGASTAKDACDAMGGAFTVLPWEG